MKIINLAIYSILIISLLSGFYILSYQKNVFSESALPCCNAGQCEQLGPPTSVYCSSYTNANIPDMCYEDLPITCKACVDFTISGCLCSGGSSYCYDNVTQTLYYGTQVQCNRVR